MSYSHAETISNGETLTAAVTSNHTLAYHLIALRHVHAHSRALSAHKHTSSGQLWSADMQGRRREREKRGSTRAAGRQAAAAAAAATAAAARSV